MGRPKQFSREEVLEKAIPVFWEKGFSETTLQDLEAVTGVNRSKLYSEFKNKEDMFFASLQHSLQTRGGDDILSVQPLGWGNIRRNRTNVLHGQEGLFLGKFNARCLNAPDRGQKDHRRESRNSP